MHREEETQNINSRMTSKAIFKQPFLSFPAKKYFWFFSWHCAYAVDQIIWRRNIEKQRSLI